MGADIATAQSQSVTRCVRQYDLSTYADLYSQLDLRRTELLAYDRIPELVAEIRDSNAAAPLSTMDLGCAKGESTEMLTRMSGLKVALGVDVNPALLKEARVRLPDTRFRLISETPRYRIPAESAAFDLVFSSWVLQDVGPFDSLVDVLHEVARVLKPAASFIVVTTGEDVLGKNFVHARFDFAENVGIRSGQPFKILFKGDAEMIIRQYYWRDVDYRRAFEAAGFEIRRHLAPKPSDVDRADPASVDESDGWLDELHTAPHVIYTLRKKHP